MKIRQWELWKSKPDGFEREHWFVVISGQELCDAERNRMVNGLPCFTLRGNLSRTCVQLDSADGLAGPTAVPCDFIFSIPKSALHSGMGAISWERQQQIKSKVKELLRL